MLSIVTFLWGDKYGVDYVERLAAGVRRHLVQPYRFLCLTERERAVAFPADVERHAIKDPELLKVRGCFARLRLFDTGWQRNRKILEEDRVVCLDLDTIITGPLDPLFDRPEPLVVLQGANSANPCPYTCTVFMFRAGANPELWTDFSLARLPEIPTFEFPDDQGWLWLKAPNAAGWTHKDGIYCMGKPGWPKGESLPSDARMVAFPGWRDPSKFTHLDWVKKHWCL